MNSMKIVTSALILSGLIVSQSVCSAKPYQANGMYAGAHLGLSTVKPRAVTADSKVLDDSDFSYKLKLGYQFKPRVAVEGFYADLGAATVRSAAGTKGKINYDLSGIAGLYTPKLSKRFTGVIKLGFAKLNNSSGKKISYKQLNNSNLFGGIGVDYQINKRLSFRSEYEMFDKDIKLLSAGFNWRF